MYDYKQVILDEGMHACWIHETNLLSKQPHAIEQSLIRIFFFFLFDLEQTTCVCSHSMKSFCKFRQMYCELNVRFFMPSYR